MEFPRQKQILRMLVLAVFGMIAIFAEAAPLGLAPLSIPSPDVLACLVAFMSLRRPGSAPILLVFALGLVRDLLTDVPVGAGALTLVLFSEALKARSLALQRRSVISEWMTVAAAIALMFAAQWLLVLITFAQPPFILDLVRQWALTTACYPAVILLLRWIFGIRWRIAEQRS